MPQHLEQHSFEIQDILGAPPRHIVRYGMGFFGLMTVLLISLTWFVHYPDTLRVSCTLTADAPALPLNAPENGRIAAVLVEDKQLVFKGQPIAILEDAAYYKSVWKVRDILSKKTSNFRLPELTELQLGQLQTPFIAFQKADNQLRFFRNLQYHQRKIEASRQKLTSLMILRENLKKQDLYSEKDIRLGQKIYNLDSTLFSRRGLTPYEFVSSERTHVRELSNYWQSKSLLVNADVQINEINQSIVDLQLDQRQKDREYTVAREESYQNLIQQIDEWSRKKVISAPSTGTLSFNTVRATNLRMKAGEIVANIIPQRPQRMFCKAFLPITGSGKVQAGQRVQVSFDNFQASEYGTIAGQVSNVALSPGENGYFLTIDLPQKLKTSYGILLPYKHDITGTAEIITADRRLLERLLTNLTNLIHHP